jgi:hypothetical protein
MVSRSFNLCMVYLKVITKYLWLAVAMEDCLWSIDKVLNVNFYNYSLSIH